MRIGTGDVCNGSAKTRRERMNITNTKQRAAARGRQPCHMRVPRTCPELTPHRRRCCRALQMKTHTRTRDDRLQMTRGLGEHFGRANGGRNERMECASATPKSDAAVVLREPKRHNRRRFSALHSGMPSPNTARAWGNARFEGKRRRRHRQMSGALVVGGDGIATTQTEVERLKSLTLTTRTTIGLTNTRK